MADVPQVPVAAVAVAVVEGKVDAVGFAVGDLILSGLHGPHVGHTPGSNDLQVGGQSLDAKLKTDLVVALSGGAVADGGGSFLSGNLHQLLGDGGTGHGSAQQIFVLVDGAGFYAGHDKVIAELVHDILNI